jgi:hypothetical protein
MGNFLYTTVQRTLRAHHPIFCTLDGPRSTQFRLNNSPSIQPNLNSTPPTSTRPSAPHKREAGEEQKHGNRAGKKVEAAPAPKLELQDELEFGSDSEFGLESE